MSHDFHWRRPVQHHLAALYDEGVKAVGALIACPYDSPMRKGDTVRLHFWRQGFEDESEKQSIEALV